VEGEIGSAGKLLEAFGLMIIRFKLVESIMELLKTLGKHLEASKLSKSTLKLQKLLKNILKLLKLL
jgi:hypothetical protein